jgi:hypothetical protein
MSLIAKRLVTLAGSTVPDPLAPGQPQVDRVQGVIALRLDPSAIGQGAGPFAFTPDFWDVLVQEDFDSTGFVVLYEAEMYPDNSIIVKRDLFGPNDFPHTWAGWPIPGDPEKPPEIVPTQADFEMLAKVKPTKGKY